MKAARATGRTHRDCRERSIEYSRDIALVVASQSTARDDSLAEPIVIFQMWRSRQRNEGIRLSLSRYKGKAICDLRVYFTTKTGHMQASKKGVAFSIDKLPEVRKALEKAGARAIDLDLIEAIQ